MKQKEIITGLAIALVGIVGYRVWKSKQETKETESINSFSSACGCGA
jgi:predicted negative regulator of RcsB-dependent stress response